MGERTLPYPTPVNRHFWSVPGDARFPYQAKPRFGSMAFEPCATNWLGGRGKNANVAATDKAIMQRATCRELSRITIYQPHAETCSTRWWLVYNTRFLQRTRCCSVFQASWFHGWVPRLCGSLGIAKCIEVTWRGIFPIGIGKSMFGLRFIMKCLTNSLGAGQSGGHA